MKLSNHTNIMTYVVSWLLTDNWYNFRRETSVLYIGLSNKDNRVHFATHNH